MWFSRARTGDDHLEQARPGGPAEQVPARVGDRRPVFLQGLTDLAGEIGVMVGAGVIVRVESHRSSPYFLYPAGLPSWAVPAMRRLALYY